MPHCLFQVLFQVLRDIRGPQQQSPAVPGLTFGEDTEDMSSFQGGGAGTPSSQTGHPVWAPKPPGVSLWDLAHSIEHHVISVPYPFPLVTSMRCPQPGR